MSDIFFEVKEAIEKEKLEKIWRILKYPIIISCVLIIAFISINEHIQSKRMKIAAEYQSMYSMAMADFKDGDVSTCVHRLNNIIENGPSGYAQLAMMFKAGIMSRMGNTKDRIEIDTALCKNYKNLESFVVCCSSLGRISAFFQKTNSREADGGKRNGDGGVVSTSHKSHVDSANHANNLPVGGRDFSNSAFLLSKLERISENSNDAMMHFANHVLYYINVRNSNFAAAKKNLDSLKNANALNYSILCVLYNNIDSGV